MLSAIKIVSGFVRETLGLSHHTNTIQTVTVTERVGVHGTPSIPGRTISVSIAEGIGLDDADTQSQATVEAIQYGPAAGFDAGSGYDFLVDSNVASSSGATFKTIAEAFAASTNGGKTIAIQDRGVPYLETVKSTLSNMTVKGIGTPKWYGSYQVTGFTQCDAGDATLLGAGYAEVYKATIPKSVIGHSAYHALLPLENGTPLTLAQKRHDVSDLFYQDSADAFYRSDAGDNVVIGTVVDSAGALHPSTITHTAVLNSYSTAQLLRCGTMVYCSPNLSKFIKVTGASGGVLTLASNTYTKQKGVDGYALLNSLADIGVGQFGYDDVSDANNITIFVRPNDVAHLANGILIAARTNILTFSNCSSPKVYGIDFGHTCDEGTGKACVMFDRVTGGHFTESTVEYYSHKEKGYGGLYFQGTINCIADFIKIQHAQNQFGVFFSAGAYTASGNRLRNAHIYRTAQSPWRMFGQKLLAVVDLFTEECGVSAHANKGNMYSQCDWWAIVRLLAKKCGGYLTQQAGSNGWYVLVECPAEGNSDDARAFDDQTSTVQPPVDPSVCEHLNCSYPVPGTNTGTGNSLCLTPDRQLWSLKWKVRNCVHNGILMDSAYLVDQPDYGVDLKNLAPVGAHDSVATAAEVFNDPDNEDWTTPAGSILTTKAGDNISADIAMLEAKFPDVDFRLTLNGYAWDPSDPGVGPYGKHWPVAA